MAILYGLSPRSDETGGVRKRKIFLNYNRVYMVVNKDISDIEIIGVICRAIRTGSYLDLKTDLKRPINDRIKIYYRYSLPVEDINKYSNCLSSQVELCESFPTITGNDIYIIVCHDYNDVKDVIINFRNCEYHPCIILITCEDYDLELNTDRLYLRNCITYYVNKLEYVPNINTEFYILQTCQTDYKTEGIYMYFKYQLNENLDDIIRPCDRGEFRYIYYINFARGGYKYHTIQEREKAKKNMQKIGLFKGGKYNRQKEEEFLQRYTINEDVF